MAFPTKLSQLCTPSYVYFIISILAMVIAGVQNMMHRNDHKYMLGMFSCEVPSCLALFAMKLIYVFFWTWILNLICKDNHTGIAWFLVLLPFIMLFIIMGGVMMYQKRNRQPRK